MASTGPASGSAGVEREQHGLVQLGEPGAQVHSPALQQPGGEAEPDGGVVVAAGQHHLGAGAGQAHQGVVQQPDDVDSGQGAVVDVAGDQDDVDGLVPDEGDELVDEGALGVEHPDAVERPAQMPVRGVQ